MISACWRVGVLAASLSALLGSWPHLSKAAEYTNPDQGYALTYPDTWNARGHVSGRGVVLRNFPPDQTPEGGFVPTGGAMIIVQLFPPYDIPAFGACQRK